MMRIGWLLMAFFSIGNLDASLWPNCIYLATFPRSGNHWVRYMLEELTGKVTGSVYCDQDHPVHSPIILPMGGYAPDFGYEGCREYPVFGEKFILKTHFPAMGEFQSGHIGAIRVVRNPIDSFYSYAIYEKKIQTGQYFPEALLSGYLKKFQIFQEFWDQETNLLTVRYEDLLKNQKETLIRIAEFLEIEFSDADIERVIKKYPPFGEYLKHKDHFSKKSLNKIRVALRNFLAQYEYDF